MPVRVHTVLEFCLALVCAMGAGFSGDMYARYSNHHHNSARHARGSHHRVRSVSRQHQDDHVIEWDLHKLNAAASAVAGENGPPVALPAAARSFAPRFTDLGPALVTATPAPRHNVVGVQRTRGPPTLA